MVKINGARLEAAGQTLAAYLKQAGYDRSRLAVEKNGAVVPRAEYETTVFEDGDEVEVVSFVGGG